MLCVCSLKITFQNIIIVILEIKNMYKQQQERSGEKIAATTLANES